ncbi:alkaline phosphatase D family protein [Aquimarina sp. 2201CG5-10]|uniref:alkaline phosphatase D family protein n=1 Tax=Aquimarina callyspongiae TaxID=3098150 RepID=UPI002AB580FB|nr:alkaline phosphatase D family protein [Aquimarina sp. 2201CG5-10]MDY8138447.1 alkaline phosphatase D family protein [Aquimarina sp. 2201CG5-10]
MKSQLHKIIVVFLITKCFYAQNAETILTKIERSPNQGNLESYFDPGLAPFYHGVASGDPLEDAVIIWTRVTTNDLSVDVNWKVATDQEMTQIIREGQVVTNQSKDYTVKIDVDGLNPFTTYYYQFEALGATSLVGKTRTTPGKQDLVDNLRFAVVSCSNYQNGYFNAYNQIANRNDIDAVIHLGDYIYEYESGGYGYSSEIGRGHLPENEIITLDDYRVRYSYYRLDPMLRNAHRQHPFINIWDDHEFANDANKFGAQNHTPSTEGSWETRKNNAYKAYFEWMPVRANTIEQYRLYRTISYGKLMDLIMLDTRIEGRETQISSSKNLISAAASNQEFKEYAKNIIAKKDLSNKEDVKEILTTVLPMVLTISKDTDKNKIGLSIEEFQFLVNSFTDYIVNKKSLDVKNKQTSDLEALLKKGTRYNEQYNTKENKSTYTSILGSEQFNWLTNQLSISEAKWRVIGNQVMVMPWNGVPSSDAWDGYKEERDRLLSFIKNNNINNLVVLTGDIHSTFAGEVKYQGDCEMCEFVVPSVTSQNLDFLGGIASGIAEFYIKLLNRHIKDVDLDNHGYYVLDVKENRVQADWYDVNSIVRPQAGDTRSRGWYVNTNDCKLRKASSQAIATNNKDSYQDVLVDEEKQKPTVTEDFIILGVYPNPLENEGNVHYLVNKDTKIAISLYDLNGKLIQELQNKKVSKGIYNLSFNADAIREGKYIIRVETGKTNVSRKIIIK